MIKLYKRIIVALACDQFEKRRNLKFCLKYCVDGCMISEWIKLSIHARTVIIEILLHMIPFPDASPMFFKLDSDGDDQ